jgi:uncharacterized OsmC-like protein
MTLRGVAGAIRRIEQVLRRRPQSGRHDDQPATAVWRHGTRVVVMHANGTVMSTDMPTAVRGAGSAGGTGSDVTPGWLFRAGLASCATTSIAMAAACHGVDLTRLEVVASSRPPAAQMHASPAPRGDGSAPGAGDVELHVRIAATGVSPERLRALVEYGRRCAPIPTATEQGVHVVLHIDVVVD